MLPGRTTAVAIESIIQVVRNVNLNPFIDAANELVTEKCAVVFPGEMPKFNCRDLPIFVPLPGGFAYADYRLELIERWLSAHFYTVEFMVSSEQRAGDVQQRFQGRTGQGLDSSLYGQHAQMLDTMGALAVLNNGQNKYAKIPTAILQGVNVGIVALGSRPRRSRFPWGGGWGSGW